MAIADYPSVDYLRQCLREEDGRLFWLHRPRDHFSSQRTWNAWNAKHAGKEAGTIQCQGRDRRCMVQFKHGSRKVKLRRHTIVWAFHKGEWCLGLDHANRDSLDDHLDNVRVASHNQNMANARLRSDNKSGYKGVHWNTQANKWCAKINVYKKQVHLGFFDDRELAHAAYSEATKKYYGEFGCDGS